MLLVDSENSWQDIYHEFDSLIKGFHSSPPIGADIRKNFQHQQQAERQGALQHPS